MARGALVPPVPVDDRQHPRARRIVARDVDEPDLQTVELLRVVHDPDRETALDALHLVERRDGHAAQGAVLEAIPTRRDERALHVAPARAEAGDGETTHRLRPDAESADRHAVENPAGAAPEPADREPGDVPSGTDAETADGDAGDVLRRA